MRLVPVESNTRNNRQGTTKVDTILLLGVALQRLEECQAREMGRAVVCFMSSHLIILLCLIPPKVHTAHSSSSMLVLPTLIQVHLVRKAGIVKNTTPHMRVSRSMTMSIMSKESLIFGMRNVIEWIVWDR